MKKQFLLSLAVVAIAGFAHADPSPIGSLPDGGQYQGHGLYRSGTDQGSYTSDVTVSVSNGSPVAIKSVWHTPKGDVTVDMIFQPTAPGFFAVQVGGKQVGDAYCLNGSNVCHYELKSSDGLAVEETFYDDGHNFFRFGSKKQPGSAERVIWQEKLTKRN